MEYFSIELEFYYYSIFFFFHCFSMRVKSQHIVASYNHNHEEELVKVFPMSGHFTGSSCREKSHRLPRDSLEVMCCIHIWCSEKQITFSPLWLSMRKLIPVEKVSFSNVEHRNTNRQKNESVRFHRGINITCLQTTKKWKTSDTITAVVVDA